MPKTAVLIHGCHLQASLPMPDGPPITWDDLVIGPGGKPSLAGRAVYGAALAHQEGAEIVIYGTGASARGGMKEGEYTYRAVLEQAGYLATWLQKRLVDVDQFLVHTHEIDVESQTTIQEVERALKLCARRGIERLIQVSSRFHAPRCFVAANEARQRLGLYDIAILASAPPDATPPPTIFEAPHRGDRSHHRFDQVLSGIFRVPAAKQADLLKSLDTMIRAYQSDS
jgi:hypothetical protein